MDGFMSCIKQKLKNRVVLVDVLAALFGMGAWLAIDGMYAQLSLLVPQAPESWNLSSYIVVLCQAANIGLIAYDLIQRFCRKKISDDFLIILLMAIASVALLLMSFFYSYRTEVGGKPHSLAFLILVFFCALVACTSSVLFIPYMNRFKKTYLVSYMIGEGLSSFIPSTTALIQGVGGNPSCVPVNASDPHSKLHQYRPPPKFTVSSFLIFMCCLQVVSLVAFVLLKTLRVCQDERVPLSAPTKQSQDPAEGSVDKTAIDEERPAAAPEESVKKMDRRTAVSLLTLQVFISFVANGLFPSIQTYSCLPYGNVAYHLAINLGSLFHPVASFAMFIFAFTSLTAVCALFSVVMAVAVYIFVLSAMSPTPPLVGTAGGEALVVISWIVYTALIAYTKLAIATRFRQSGGKGLYWYGTYTQVGAAIGAVLGFCLLNYTHMFHSYHPC